MSRPTFDPFADEPTQPTTPRALEWVDASTLPAYAEDAHGRVLFDHREGVTARVRSGSKAAALGCAAGMIVMAAAAAAIIGAQR